VILTLKKHLCTCSLNVASAKASDGHWALNGTPT
jgi:hypothetical protein